MTLSTNILNELDILNAKFENTFGYSCRDVIKNYNAYTQRQYQIEYAGFNDVNSALYEPEHLECSASILNSSFFESTFVYDWLANISSLFSAGLSDDDELAVIETLLDYCKVYAYLTRRVRGNDYVDSRYIENWRASLNGNTVDMYDEEHIGKNFSKFKDYECNFGPFINKLKLKDNTKLALLAKGYSIKYFRYDAITPSFLVKIAEASENILSNASDDQFILFRLYKYNEKYFTEDELVTIVKSYIGYQLVGFGWIVPKTRKVLDAILEHDKCPIDLRWKLLTDDDKTKAIKKNPALFFQLNTKKETKFDNVFKENMDNYIKNEGYHTIFKIPTRFLTKDKIELIYKEFKKEYSHDEGKFFFLEIFERMDRIPKIFKEIIKMEIDDLWKSKGKKNIPSIAILKSYIDELKEYLDENKIIDIVSHKTDKKNDLDTAILLGVLGEANIKLSDQAFATILSKGDKFSFEVNLSKILKCLDGRKLDFNKIPDDLKGKVATFLKDVTPFGGRSTTSSTFNKIIDFNTVSEKYIVQSKVILARDILLKHDAKFIVKMALSEGDESIHLVTRMVFSERNFHKKLYKQFLTSILKARPSDPTPIIEEIKSITEKWEAECIVDTIKKMGVDNYYVCRVMETLRPFYFDEPLINLFSIGIEGNILNKFVKRLDVSSIPETAMLALELAYHVKKTISITESD